MRAHIYIIKGTPPNSMHSSRRKENGWQILINGTLEISYKYLHRDTRSTADRFYANMIEWQLSVSRYCPWFPHSVWVQIIAAPHSTLESPPNDCHSIGRSSHNSPLPSEAEGCFWTETPRAPSTICWWRPATRRIAALVGECSAANRVRASPHRKPQLRRMQSNE